jgi:hypothetical protein
MGLIGTFFPMQIIAKENEWITQLVVLGEKAWCITNTSIDIDSKGIPHISYHDSCSGEVKYVSFNGDNWDVEIVDSVLINDVGSTSLAFDQNDIPHISYYEGNKHLLKYAYWTGSAWHTEEVSPPASNGRESSIAIDSNGYPHISWSGSGYNFMYSRWTGSSWETTTIENDARKNSLGLDSNNFPHISYFVAGSTNSLKYATYNGTIWNTTIVDSPPPSSAFGTRNSLAIDSNNLPHIAYSVEGSGGNPNSIKYAKWNGATWEKEILVSSASVWFSSVALSLAKDIPHVSYTTSTGHSLHYLQWNDTNWAKETIDEEEVGYVSMSLDSNGCPYISYVTVDGLKYANKCYRFPWPMFLPAITNITK